MRYWWKCAVLLKTWGCYPSFWLSWKINPTLWRFQANPLRIDWDIDENVQFYLKHGVVTPHFDRLKKLALLCEGFKPDVPHCFPHGIHPVVSPIVSPIISTMWFPHGIHPVVSLVVSTPWFHPLFLPWYPPCGFPVVSPIISTLWFLPLFPPWYPLHGFPCSIHPMVSCIVSPVVSFHGIHIVSSLIAWFIAED